ncbi:FlaD/FlaE family flagellar protein [Halorubrum vacuolatum]|uniref:Flagellar protein FlaD n=1 Tax=Halorubrum vacuolatum TaxID=63740 RepID=A0A238VP97_HALVU|nr:FlaD/FlaE family flagellar protein [Halorubrum vacuolatum]SNR36182.1 flagellar protein FlaD [Halorubrum vacuolatum]
MSLNPRHYDVRELRSLAGGTRATADGAPRERPLRLPNRNRAEQAARSAAFTEILLRQRNLRKVTDGERPYLTAVPSSPAAEHEIADWLGYLVDVGGHLRSRDALSYYAEIGWITPAVAKTLTRRLPGYEPPRHDRPFTPADHRISLVSLVRLVSCASEHP